MIESWRAVPGYNGLYEVSDMGRVRSYQSRGVGKPSVTGAARILSQQVNSNGYMRANVCGKLRLVHRLVMLAFVGESDLEVNHKNADRTDNRLENLEYMSLADNRRYAFDVLGKRRQGGPKGERSGSAKVTEHDVQSMRKKYESGIPVSDLQREYGIARSTCIRIINGKTWGHVSGAVKMSNPRNPSGKNGR